MRSNRDKKVSKKVAQRRFAFTLILLIVLLALAVFGINKITSKLQESDTKLAENSNVLQNEEELNIEQENVTNNQVTENNTIENKVTNNDVQGQSNNKNNTVNGQNQSNNENKVSTTKLKNGLPVLMYHFFYDKNQGSGQDNNWMEISDFEAQMKYLSDNNFYFPTWEEVENYIDGKIELPEKSVAITVDDGDDSFFELAVPVIQKYNAKATSFVITSWYGYRAGNKQLNISYQSHSDCMHEGASNGKGVMLSWSYDKIMADVKQSSQTLGGSTVFCYPFGQYNELDKKVLKDAGYKLAFTTEGGRVYKGSDKYALPRVRMSRGVSINSFASMVK